MKEHSLSLYELIGLIREKSNSFLSKQFIVDFAVERFSKLLNSKAVIEVCKILLQNYCEAYTLTDNLEYAIQDFIELNSND